MKVETPRTARLAIVTCIKNEGEDLVEWLCYHRHVGVSEFVVYDNLSTDATQRILKAIPFRDAIRVHRIDADYAQKSAFADAIRRYRKAFDWVAFLDGDEFIVPLGDMTLPRILEEFERKGVAGFGINWRIFGSGGHRVRPAGLVTESFGRRAPDRFKPNAHIKSVVRIAKIQKTVTQHYFRMRGIFLLDDGSEPPKDFRGIRPAASFEQGFAIHHYATKSYAQCMKKIARGRPRPASSPEKYRPLNYWNLHDRNDLIDWSAAQIIAPISKKVRVLRDKIGRD